VWVGLTVGMIVLFIVSLPTTFEHLLTICRHGACDSTQLSAGRAAALSRLHISRPLYAGYFVGLFVVFAAVCIVMGGLVFVRRSTDRGALVVATFLVTLGVSFPDVIDWQSSQGPVWAFFSSLLYAFFAVVVLAFFYVFPDGRFAPSWTRWLLAAAAYWQVANAYLPTTPFNPQNWPQPLPSLPFVLLLLSALYAQIYRYRRLSSPLERQQTKLVVMGVTGALLVFVGLVLLADLALTPQQRDNVIGTWVALTVYQVVWLAVPVSVGASILRYRLYDIDVLINRALVYGSLTASIAIVYIGAVIGLQALVQVITGHHSDLTIAVATLAVAALFNPWRHRLQRFVDRRFYRRKYDASRTLAAFSAQIRDEVDLDRLSRNLLGAVEQTVQPANIAIWLPREGETA
jgi:hypothetical protein